MNKQQVTDTRHKCYIGIALLPDGTDD